MSKAKQQVIEFIESCMKHGFTWEVASNSVIRIKKTFAAGDKNAFAECDMFACDVLAKAPLKGGSVWGTDGGSIGGYVGLTKGEFVMNKSGQGSRFVNELRKHAGYISQGAIREF